MNVLVLLAGIIDPNWRLDEARIAPLSDGEEDANEPRKLSPFDEAALEMALQLRDEQPATRVTAILFGGAGSDKLLRSVAAFRPDRLFRVDVPSVGLWDARHGAERLRAALTAQAAPSDPVQPDLILIGREFGDCDNGVLPPYFAEMCGLRFVGQVERARQDGDALLLTRTRGSCEEEIRLPPPLVAAMTNDRRNRLRHPLFKNVVAAKRETLAVLPLAAAEADHSPALRRAAARLSPPPKRETSCRWLQGSLEQQADDLAALLPARESK
jgi:electron transfer flavoprotein beta subunit